jgi:putative endonuclease
MPSPSQAFGFELESVAERRLEEDGYEILHRNWRGGGGEIDRIARDGEVLVFVEIRARRTDAHGEPWETVGFAKQRRLARAALAYLGQPEVGWPSVRFDVISVLVRPGEPPEIEVYRDAFWMESFMLGRGIPMV